VAVPLAPHPIWIIPFALLLVSIAIAPMINSRWWERWYAVFALALGAIPAVHFLFLAPNAGPWVKTMEDYAGFIVLVGSLYIVSGGIVIEIERSATPLSNCVLLLLGAILSNVVGTTGASMLLIRPYLRMNRGRLRPYHVIFFIFLVSNIGGLLAPVGNPPLFLGYLNGVPFWWTLDRCRWIWLAAVSMLLLVFFVRDVFCYSKTQPISSTDRTGPAVGILGVHHLLFMVAIVWAVFLPGMFELGWTTKVLLSREVIMTVAAIASLLLTPQSIHQRNDFSPKPLIEVAILFLGIFSTMAAALAWLDANASRLQLQTPGQFFFAAGGLSSILDNAPTYLSFFHIVLDKSPGRDVHLLLSDPQLSRNLVAISVGAVLFGACTYIGNGPNFMVKSIAERSGLKMPHFIEYIYGYTLAILLPVFVIIWLVFL